MKGEVLQVWGNEKLASWKAVRGGNLRKEQGEEGMCSEVDEEGCAHH